MPQAQVGGLVPNATHGRSLVTGREEILHKCAGIEDSQIANNDIRSITQSRDVSSCKVGTHVRIALSNEDKKEKKFRITSISYNHFHNILRLFDV